MDTNLIASKLKEAAHAILHLFEREDRALDLNHLTQMVALQCNQEYPDWIVMDFFEEDGVRFVIAQAPDGLQKIPYTISGDTVTLDAAQPVNQTFQGRGAHILTRQQTDGSWRWFALPAAVATVNRVDEIDSSRLFQSFADYANRTQRFPKMDFMHLEENFLLGEADWVEADGYTYLASGTFADTPEGNMARTTLEKYPDYWGFSIQYWPLSQPETIEVEGRPIPVYNRGINTFISLVPEHLAASEDTSVFLKENRMKPTTREAMLRLADGDEEVVKAAEARLSRIDAAIQEGRVARTTEPESADAPAATPPEPKEEAQPNMVNFELDEETFRSLVEAVGKTPESIERKAAVDALVTKAEELEAALAERDAVIADLTAKVDALTTGLAGTTERLTKLETGEDEKKAAWLKDLPAKTQVRVTHRARELAPTQPPTFADKAASVLDRMTPQA